MRTMKHGAQAQIQTDIIKAITPRVADLAEQGMDFEAATDQALNEWRDYLAELAEGRTERAAIIRSKIEERTMDGVGCDR